MHPDAELVLRLRLDHLEAERAHLIACLTRLLRHVRPSDTSAKQISAKEVRGITVPARALATALRILAANPPP